MIKRAVRIVKVLQETSNPGLSRRGKPRIKCIREESDMGPMGVRPATAFGTCPLRSCLSAADVRSDDIRANRTKRLKIPAYFERIDVLFIF